jgi:hypothetical protein
MSANQYPNKFRWITIDAGACINGEALVQAVEFGQSGHVIGAMTCFKCDGSQFIKDYPNQPAIAIQSI